MKNLKLVLFFGGTLILLFPLIGLSQTQEVAQSPGLLSKIGNWFNGGVSLVVFTVISTLIAKKGWSIIIKHWAAKVRDVALDLSHISLDVADFAGGLDNMIAEDGKIDGNSKKELLDKGKHLIVEGKDFVMTLKPKPVK